MTLCTNRCCTVEILVLGVTSLLLTMAWVGTAEAAFFGREPEWPALKRSTRERHPTVPQLTTAALRAWLADVARVQPVLLDSRLRAEFAVSHLKDARHAPDIATALRMLEGRAKDTPIVVYCSVGVRSSALAERLMREGFRVVSNLEGSIFEWANLGYPIYLGAVPVSKVHPYNDNWGRLLKRGLWADVEITW
jgi:rhodanese-related sulfurtransferase